MKRKKNDRFPGIHEQVKEEMKNLYDTGQDWLPESIKHDHFDEDDYLQIDSKLSLHQRLKFAEDLYADPD